MKKIVYLVIFMLIVFSVYMRFKSIFWELPSETMCLMSYASDEGYTISALKNINPNKLDFDVDDSKFKYLSFGLSGDALTESLSLGKVSITYDNNTWDYDLIENKKTRAES